MNRCANAVAKHAGACFNFNGVAGYGMLQLCYFHGSNNNFIFSKEFAAYDCTVKPKTSFMKNVLLGFFLISFISNASAQLKATLVCPEITVNILQGSVNGLDPDFTPGQIKKTLPCFTSELPESDTSKCGGLIAYKNQDIYFYTGRDYVEIGEKFKGKLSIPLMGAARGSLFQYLGYAKLKDVDWDAFVTAYGILVLHYNKAGKINLIQFSKKTAETLKLCE